MKELPLSSIHGLIAVQRIRLLDMTAKGDYIAPLSSELRWSGGESLRGRILFSGVSGDTRSNLA